VNIHQKCGRPFQVIIVGRFWMIPEDWLVKAVNRRLREELEKLQVVINEDKSRMVDLKQGESFTFLGFEYRRILSLRGKWRPYYAPKLKKRTALFEKLRRSSGNMSAGP
jgi:hypothetical protein